MALLSGDSNSISLGVRHHVVMTVEGTTMKSYLNGALLATKSDGWEPTSMTRSSCWIGKSNRANIGYFNGEVSSLKLYSGAIAPAEVAAAYARVTTHFVRELKHYWDFTNAASDTIIDSVGGIAAVHWSDGANDRTASGIVLDGVDDHIVLDFSSVLFGGTVTVEAFVTFETQFHVAMRIFDCGNGRTSDNIVLGNNDVTGQLLMSTAVGRRFHTLSWGSNSDLMLGVPHHIVATVRDGLMRTYVNGVMTGEKFDGAEPVSQAEASCACSLARSSLSLSLSPSHSHSLFINLFLSIILSLLLSRSLALSLSLSLSLVIFHTRNQLCDTRSDG